MVTLDIERERDSLKHAFKRFIQKHIIIQELNKLLFLWVTHWQTIRIQINSEMKPVTVWASHSIIQLTYKKSQIACLLL